ncbi:MAG: hypothetical protein DWQ04_19535 [Chloroflexi bacterium]|nr:MAG: hypothetical protein DWQ04_19535 [Chloroflexota bacterium]
MTEHIFIIRIWREHRDLDYTQSILRSVIQHVPSGKKSLLSDFDSILEFTLPYLQDSDDHARFRKQIDLRISQPQTSGNSKE